MKKTAVFTLTLLVLSTIGLQTTFAQDSPQLNLPEGATARLGKGQITEVTYSPDGTRLAVASSIGIWIYDAQTGEELNPIIGHTGFVNSVSFSPDGQTLVSGSRGGTVRLWDAETCTNLNTLNGHTASVNSVSFSPDGQTLVSGSSDRTVRLWDAETRTNLNTLNGHTASVNSVSFSPDGQTLVSGSRDETVRLWDADTGINLHTLTGHTDSVNSVSFSPDGQVLVSGSSDGTIWLWDVDTRKHIRTIKATHVPGFADVNSVAFSPDGSMLVSAADDTTIRLWDVDTGQHIRSIRFLDTDFVDLVSLWDVSFSPDGNTIVCSSEFNAVTLWDVNTGEHIGTLNTIRGHTDAVNSIAFSPDGNTLVSGGRDKTLRLWNVDTGQHIRLITGRQHRLADSLLTYHLVYVVSVAFSPDGNTIASGSDRIRLWDADTGRYKDTLERYIQYLYSIAFSPDRNTIASASQVGGLSLWDADTGQRIHRLTRRLGALSVSFSPDGQTLASGSWGGDIRLWDVETGQHLDTLTGHTGAVRSVSFSPDGQVLASSSDDATIRLWDAETGTNLHTLTGHTDSVNSVAFSSDGNTIASGSSDATIRLWDVETGQHLDTLTGHTDSVKSVTFSPDSSTLASGSWDWTVLLWDVSEWMGPRPTPTDVRGPSVTKMSNVTDGEEADLEVLNRDGIIIEFDEDIAYSSLKLTLEDGTDLGWESTVKDNSVILTPFAGKELVHETSYVVSGTVRDGVGNETDLTLTFVAVKPPGAMPNALEADINGDGVVNILDLVLVASNLGQTGQNAGDVNGDGVVNILDLVKVAGALGNAAAAPSLHPQALEMFTSADVHQWLTQAQHLKLTDATSQRGILFLEQLLAALIPKETALLPNYPNPFNPETWIPYRLAEDAFVTLTIYNGSGRVVRTLDVGHRTAAFYESRSKAIYWDGRNEFGESVASGVYFYHLSAGDYSALRRMVILK